jgi:hypothetical protein
VRLVAVETVYAAIEERQDPFDQDDLQRELTPEDLVRLGPILHLRDHEIHAQEEEMIGTGVTIEIIEMTTTEGATVTIIDLQTDEETEFAIGLFV